MYMCVFMRVCVLCVCVCACVCVYFSALRQTVFTEHQLSIRATHLVYQACVLSTFLFGSER